MINIWSQVLAISKKECMVYQGNMNREGENGEKIGMEFTITLRLDKTLNGKLHLNT